MPLPDFPALLDRVEQGTAAEDVPVLERLAREAPGHVTACVALARACEQGDRWEQAHRSWQRAYLLLPGSPAVRAGLRRTAHHAARKPQAASEASGAAQGEAKAEPPPDGDAPAESTSAARTSASGEGIAPPAPGSKALQELVSSLPENAEAGAHDNLDSLIEELESARIEPTPDPDAVPAPNLDTGDDDMVSPTLARIYQAQGQYAEAARVYRRLAQERPAQADEYRREAEAMQARADEEHGRAGERERSHEKDG